MKVAISFDDGIREQFAWAELLHIKNIIGTFYINPMVIGRSRYLTVEQLRIMHDDMNHTIANHMWTHDAPSNCENMNEILFSFNRAKTWLSTNGFEDGINLLALPYGSIGGNWNQETILELLNHCIQIRDVNSGVNDLDASRFVGATESTTLISKDCLALYYFHGHANTSDYDFSNFISNLDGKEITSMKAIANIN